MPFFYSKVHVEGGHTKRVNTANYQIIPLESKASYICKPHPGSDAGRTSITRFGADGSTNFSSYQKPCLWLDGKHKLHLPKPGETTINCDEKSMIIHDPPTPQDDSDGGSNHSASSGRSLKDNVWNRTFHGHPGERNTAEKVGRKVAHSVKSLFKSAQHFMGSCFDESSKTQSKRRSASSSYGSDYSPSSSDMIRQLKSNPSDKGYSEEQDEDRSVKGGWMGRLVPQGWKCGSHVAQTSEETRCRI